VARRAAFLDSVRAQTEVVLVDAGNFTGHQLETAEARSLFLLEAMKQLEYDAITLGESDASLGGELLRALVEGGAYPFVSANIVDTETGELLCPPVRIVERGGMRVGITAVTQFAHAVMHIVRDAGLDATDPAVALGEVLPELRQQTDFVIVLARMHSRRAQDLGEKYPDLVDVMVIGNREPNEGLAHPENGGAVYVRSGDRGQAFGVTRVALAGGRVDRITADEEVLTRHRPEDPELAATVEEFQRTINDLVKLQVAAGGSLGSSPDGHYYLGAENCASCHPREFELWSETPHAHAFETLVGAGQEALPECFMCHVTGHGDPIGYDPAVQGDSRLVNVQCEACHDKGSRHARDGSYGRALLMQSCGKCHDSVNSPNFDPEIYWLMMEH
jgi:hypothetical protein